MTGAADLSAGARNLLVSCARLTKGETLLIVREPSRLGWYDSQAPDAVAAEARKLGVELTIVEADVPGSGGNAGIADVVAQHDCTVFFARIGDQDRFSEPVPGRRSVMVYARDAAALGSAFGTSDHRAMIELKRCVNDLLIAADTIEISCSLGTRLVGRSTNANSTEPADVSVMRFPMGVPAPTDARHFSGRVALANYLTTTGSRSYQPASIAIDGTVQAEIENGRIKRFTGDPEEVDKIQRHYDHVSAIFGIDKFAINSWHAGIHPACGYYYKVADNPDRWSNNVFPNPRFLHFHTCGDYAPGEICWMVLDPTISLDGVNLWENGQLCLSRFKSTDEWLSKWPQLGHVFSDPEMQVGL